MKKEIPGFVRELPVTILFLILVFGVVFYPLYSRWWNRNSEEKQAGSVQAAPDVEETVDNGPGERHGAPR
ncbi:MAG: hypothetical protein IJT68_08990 [Lentisphaeria bacterium]|nr:hypothetical protein [Lentisphaeria bacterium]